MNSDLGNAIIKIRRDTAGNWTTNNPTPNQGEWCLETDTDKIKIGDGSTAWTSLEYAAETGIVTSVATNVTDIATNVTDIATNVTDIATNVTDIAAIEALVDPIGNVKYFATYKDRSAKGLIPFDFNNKVAITGTYADLYAEVGDTFEAQHVAAGDAVSGAGYFYPTSVPGGYNRAGVPDSAAINATTGVDDSAETIALTTSDISSLKLTRGVIGTGADGVPIQVKLVSGSLPGGLAILTTYFCRFKTATTLELYDTEAHAINTGATTGRVDLTVAVGTFSITQEGIVLGDKMQQITGDIDIGYVSINAGNGALGRSNSASIVRGATADTGYRQLEFDSVDSPDARTSNENRGRTTVLFAYIKAIYIT